MCKQLRRSLLLVLLLVLLAPSMAGAKIVGWWKLDDGAGTTAVDSSGNKYNGTIVGTPQWVAGQLGGALKLSGSSNYVNCGVIPIATNGTGAISVCFWVNRAASGDHKFCSNRQGNNAAGGGFTCAVYQDRMEMDLSDASTRVLSRDATRPTIPGVNIWVHLAWVYDDAANTLKLYVNGTLTVTATVTQSVGLSTQFFRLGSDSPNAGYYPNATIDDFRLYDHALTEAEITGAMKGMGPGYGQAGSASPADKATDVIREVTLGWTAGKFAKTHDVYFGTAFADVNDASRTSPKGVLVGQGQADTTYNAGRLEFGKTYFWRVDEVNAPPDSTIYKGTTWQFTVEPYSYAVLGKAITATASSVSTPDMGPQKTIDGSGMIGDQHGTSSTDMWLSAKAGAEATWIQYAFDKPYKLHQMLVWNSNQLIESFLGFGAKGVMIEYSVDGNTWKTLGDFEFARAPGAANYAANTTVDFAGAMAQYVKLTFKSNWGGVVTQYGLSEVRFLQVPVAAREPSPAPGAANVAPEARLNWRAGREAGAHQVFLGTDPNNLPLAATVQTPSYDADLNLGQSYYWKIVEVNEAKDPATWPSDVWSFATVPFFVVDDFESYTDSMEENQAIFQVWVDGYGTTTNGAVVGNSQAPFAETTIIQGGKQAMPLAYANSGGPTYSETERVFDPPQDWTKHGYQTLALSFYGDPNNTGQLYFKINSTKILYNGKTEDLKRTQWQPWNIDLATSGADLKSVKKIAIGVDGAGASGILRFDNICLYPTAGALIAPVDPGMTGLVAWYKFDGDFKDSAGTFAGTARGDAKIVSDPARGQVLSLDGIGDAVAVPKLGSGNALTIAMWVNTAVDPVPIQFESFFHANGWEAGDLHWRYSYGKVNSGINGAGADLGGVSIAKANQWNHVAITVSPTECALWLNGLQEASRTLATPATVTLGEGLIGAWLGTDGTTITRAFTGKIDDVRFYNRALSAEEIASLAGRTEPFAKAF
jgi:hypothetical protein